MNFQTTMKVVAMVLDLHRWEVDMMHQVIQAEDINHLKSMMSQRVILVILAQCQSTLDLEDDFSFLMRDTTMYEWRCKNMGRWACMHKGVLDMISGSPC